VALLHCGCFAFYSPDRRSLEELVPYSCARVLVPEGGRHVLALGERQIPEPRKTSPKYHPGHPLTLIADKSPFLKPVLEDRKSILIPDTKKEEEWQTFKGHIHLRSWLSVPLMASGEYLGFLLSATLIPIAIPKTIFGAPSCCRFLLLRPFKTPGFLHGLISMHQSWKNAIAASASLGWPRSSALQR